MLDPTGGPISGAKNWSSGYMPASLPGRPSSARPASPSSTSNRPDGHDRGGPAPAARHPQRLQRRAPGRPRRQLATSPRGSPATRWPSRCSGTPPRPSTSPARPDETKALYGLDDDRRPRDFGRRCLLARRLVERGVRFVQLYAGGAHNDSNWDAHGDLEKNHTYHAGRTDKPIAGLLKDLKRRGLLDETLVIWGGEFGRQPTAEYAKGTGRDHNAYGFTMWMAGGGIKGGVSVGETDELGGAAVADRFHVKNLHATVAAASSASTPTG